MKVLKKIIIWLVVIIAILVLVAYLLPGTYKVERSTLIKADRDMIFNMACDFNNWELWSPWSSDMDSTVVYTLIGNCEVGAVQQWDGEEMGRGEMTITGLVPGEKITWDLGFQGFSQKMAIGMYFEPEGEEWLVTWTAEGELGYNPLYRYYGLMIDSDLGADFEKGLQQLKEVCESLPDYPGITIVELTATPAVAVRDSVAMADMQPFMETFFPKLYMYALRNQATISGHPYSIYYSWDPEGISYMEVGLPLDMALEGEDEIIPAETPAGKAVKGVYFGPYEGLNTVYTAMEQYMQVMKLEDRGMAWEVYITDPMQEPDTARWETHVFFPLK
jgi:effector-binding domain-containing protein